MGLKVILMSGSFGQGPEYIVRYYFDADHQDNLLPEISILSLGTSVPISILRVILFKLHLAGFLL